MKKKYTELCDEDVKWLESLNNYPKVEIVTSRKHKIKMNRIFRERVGSENIPFPEVDSLLERFRSQIVRKINKVKKS